MYWNLGNSKAESTLPSFLLSKVKIREHTQQEIEKSLLVGFLWKNGFVFFWADWHKVVKLLAKRKKEREKERDR